MVLYAYHVVYRMNVNQLCISLNYIYRHVCGFYPPKHIIYLLMSNFPVWKFRRVRAIQAILRATADRKSWKSRYVPTLLIVHHDPRLPYEHAL